MVWILSWVRGMFSLVIGGWIEVRLKIWKNPADRIAPAPKSKKSGSENGEFSRHPDQSTGSLSRPLRPSKEPVNSCKPNNRRNLVRVLRFKKQHQSGVCVQTIAFRFSCDFGVGGTPVAGNRWEVRTLACAGNDSAIEAWPRFHKRATSEPSRTFKRSSHGPHFQ